MESNQYDYLLTSNAENDIDSILEYIAVELVNPEAAGAFADALDEKFDELCKNPKQGRIVDNDFLRRDDVRKVNVKNYLVYYLIDEEKLNIVILGVVFSGRNQDEILKKYK
jgi:plasmid stabilization system protein ParE